MRAALVVAAVALGVAIAGCQKSDPCAGVSGTCVALTVQSSTVSAVDSLRIVASGAVTGTHTSMSGRASLPIKVALKLPATARGAVHLAVAGLVAGNTVGSGSADATVTPGQHVDATCTLVSLGSVMGDMSGEISDLAGADLTVTGGGGGDMRVDLGMPPKPCDPAGVTGPQCVWRWQQPLPQGDALVGVAALSDASTFTVNISGQLLHRDATGWTALTQVASGASRVTLARTLFTDQNTDLYVGGTITTGGTNVLGILHSTDSGSTWTVESLPTPTISITGIGQGATASASAILPASGTAPVFYSRNFTNNTWSQNTTAATNASNWYAATIAQAAVLVGAPLATPTGAAISYSNNPGFTTWNAVPTITGVANTTSYTSVCSAQSGGAMASYWAVGGTVIVHASGLTPSTWTQQAAANTAQLYGCVAADSTHAWAFGVNGAVLYTTDGTNWNGATTGSTQELMYGGHSPTATALTLVGNSGAIYRSTNGTTFTAEQTGYTGLVNTMFGVAPKTAFAVGPNDTILRTVDDGATWTQLSTPMTGAPATTYFSGVWGASATDVYAVGDSGVLLHSSDGMSFTKSAAAGVSTVSFDDVYGSSLGVYAVGRTGLPGPRSVFRSTDHGATWSPITITGFTGVNGNAALTVFATSTDVWIGGDANIYHSTNGTTFTSQPVPTSLSGNGVLGVLSIRGNSSGSDVWAIQQTMNGDYVRSHNGGAWTAATGTWTDIPIHVVVQPDDSAIYVLAADTFQPQFSTNQGSSWGPIDTRIAAELNFNGGFAFAPNDLFLVGATGIVHYGN